MADDPQAAPPVTLDSIRQQYPQYKNVDDDTLARGLHEKFYSQMPFNDFAAKVGYKTDTTAATTDEPSALSRAGTQIGHGLMDAAGSVAHGVGTSLDIGHNMLAQVGVGKEREYNAPDSNATKFAAPFQHDPDAPEAPDVKEQIRQNAPKLGDTPAAKAIMNNPTMQAIGKNVIAPAADAAGAGAALAGAPGAIKAGLEGASDMLGGASTAGKARIAANPQLVRARADGFKFTADDVRAKTNPADANSPNADLPGPSSTTPDVADKINVHNQKMATQKMAEDVKLPNTRNINPDEVSERMAQEGKVYGQVGDAIGTGAKPTPVLDHDISMAGVKDADPSVQAKVDKDVSFYRDELKGNFDGPKAVQTVRTLRNSAQELMNSNVPGDQARGRTYQNIANAVEDEMMRQLPAGAQDLHTAFPAARQQLAKLYELNEVSEGGQVNPAKVAQLRTQGKPLSGAADAVANAAEVAPESMQGPRGSPTHITTAPQGRGFWIDSWNLGKAALHKIPGLNPASDAYQASRYGEVGGLNATPPASAKPNVSEVRPPVKVTPPPGNAGNGRQTEMPLPPGRDELKLTHPPGEAGGEGPAPYQGQIKYPTDRTPDFELTHPEGTALEPTQRPLVRRNTAGDVMAPADWDREALARVRAMSPRERIAAEGPAVPFDKLSTTVKSRGPRPLGRAFDRERE